MIDPLQVLKNFKKDLDYLGNSYMTIESRNNGKYMGKSSSTINDLNDALAIAILSLEQDYDWNSLQEELERLRTKNNKLKEYLSKEIMLCNEILSRSPPNNIFETNIELKNKLQKLQKEMELD